MRNVLLVPEFMLEACGTMRRKEFGLEESSRTEPSSRAIDKKMCLAGGKKEAVYFGPEIASGSIRGIK